MPLSRSPGGNEENIMISRLSKTPALDFSSNLIGGGKFGSLAPKK